MSQVVYKYELKPGKNVLPMPSSAQILTAAGQNDGVFIWAKLRPKNPTEKRTFEIYGTGHEIPDANGELRFIGTAQMFGGQLIWHVFERVSA